MTDRQCAVCGTVIEGRPHKFLCSNACTIRLHRIRKAATIKFKDYLFSLHAVEEIDNLVSNLTQEQTKEVNQCLGL